MADLPVEATHPAWHCLVGFGRLQWAQAVGAHQDYLVIAAATGLMGRVPLRGVNGFHRDLVSGLVLTMP
jgi:hypothetical protein